ncbi:MAG: hypothetical protein NVSMB14_12770 [Isosphaeraceae bacterium]
MTNLAWATPKALGELTITQLQCLMYENEPSGNRLLSAAEYKAEIERQKAEDEAWRSS